MRIVQRLYLKDFFVLLLLIVIGLASIFSLLDLIGRLDDFSSGKPSIGRLVLYAFFNVPRLALYLLPMSVLVCGLFTFSQAFRRREITAIKAAGGSLKNLFRPFVISGLVLALSAFVLGEFVSPLFATKAADLKNRMEGKGKLATFREGMIWLKTRDGFPVKIDLYNPEERVAQGITVFVFGDRFLKERIVARQGRWDGNVWQFQGCEIVEFESGRSRKVTDMKFEGLDSPDIFASDLKGVDEMGFLELNRYYKRLRAAGFNNSKVGVDLHTKISFPLINIFMMLLGVALSVRGRTGGGLVSAGLGLLISLCYWLGYTFTLSLGYAGIVPSLLSAWTVPAVFSGFAAWMYRAMPE